MELLLVVEQQVPKFVRRCEVLSHGGMVRVDPDDCLRFIPIQKTRYVVLQGLVEKSSSFCFVNSLYRHRSCGDVIGCQQISNQEFNLASSNGHESPPSP